MGNCDATSAAHMPHSCLTIRASIWSVASEWSKNWLLLRCILSILLLIASDHLGPPNPPSSFPLLLLFWQPVWNDWSWAQEKPGTGTLRHDIHSLLHGKTACNPYHLEFALFHSPTKWSHWRCLQNHSQLLSLQCALVHERCSSPVPHQGN